MKPIIAVPATLALVYRAWSRKSLTPLGIVVAALTAVAHAVHPWSIFFALLVVFFLAGTTVTKVKHDVKARLTHSSSGSPSGEGPRNHVQVLANSLVASVLILWHAWTLRGEPEERQCFKRGSWPRGSDILVAGIVANYAAVAADTFSSELGILAAHPPRLITAPWRVVPPGTNGGVTTGGLLAGFLGAFLIALVADGLMPFCHPGSSSIWSPRQFRPDAKQKEGGWTMQSRSQFMLAMVFLGTCGSVLDSLLGALLQASVVDVRTGLVIEGEGGKKVPVQSTLHLKESANVRSKTSNRSEGAEAVAKTSALEKNIDQAAIRGRRDGGSEVAKGEKTQSRRVETGRDILSNNGVNFVMALSMSCAAIAGAGFLWDVPLKSLLRA